MLEQSEILEKLSINYDCNLSDERKMKLREEAEKKINFEIAVLFIMIFLYQKIKN
jgi:hypothetical protein